MPSNELSVAEKLITYLFSPLFSTLSFLFACYLVYIFYKWRNQVKAPVWAWDKYLEVLIKEEEYEEVQRLQTMIDGKDYYDKVKTPQGYKVRKRDKLDLEDRFEEMTFVIRHSFIFTRKQDKGSKGFEIKDEKN